MFGRNRPVYFDPYRGRRSHWRLPRWLVLLLVGIAIGAAAVIGVQERVLPPRLSASESTRLQAAFGQADAERLRLQSALDGTTRQRDSAVADAKALREKLATTEQDAHDMAGDLAFVVESLPPDPRAGAVAVRVARFAVDQGVLRYSVVLTRETHGAKSISAVMQLQASGTAADGAARSVALPPVKLSIGHLEVLRGRLPLPDGFTPREVGIRVLDGAGRAQLGMRVLRVE